MTAPTDRAAVTARLDAIEAAHAAATPVPWFAWNRGVGWHIAIEDPTGVDHLPGRPYLLPEGLRTDLARAEDAAAIVAAHNNAAWLVAAVRGVLDKHVPWYEISGVRHEHAVTVPCCEFGDCNGDTERDCDASDGDGHEVPACAECRWSDGDMDGYLLWPCPTVRVVTAALGEA